MEEFQENLAKLNIKPEEIVNIHAHIPQMNEELRESVESDSHPLIPSDLIDEIIPTIKPETYCGSNRKFIGMSGILAIGPHNIHEKSCPIYASNGYVLSLAKRFPEFFIPFGSLNLQDYSAIEKMDDLKNQGIIGIKYHALEGYPLVECMESLKRMNDLKMPLIVHLGDTPFSGVNLEYADPSFLIPIANRFPDLKILITHFGTPLHFKAFWIATRYENVFMDTAEYPIYWKKHDLNPYGPLLSPLHTKRVGIEKFVFGTDFPMPTLVFNEESEKVELQAHSIECYINKFCELPETYLSNQEKKDILCNNVWDFLGLEREEIIKSNKKI